MGYWRCLMFRVNRLERIVFQGVRASFKLFIIFALSNGMNIKLRANARFCFIGACRPERSREGWRSRGDNPSQKVFVHNLQAARCAECFFELMRRHHQFKRFKARQRRRDMGTWDSKLISNLYKIRSKLFKRVVPAPVHTTHLWKPWHLSNNVLRILMDVWPDV